MTTVYQNAKIVKIHHDEVKNQLTLGFAGLPEKTFDCVVDFALHGFYPQNILFDVYEYDVANLPSRIAAEFPLLSYYLHSGENWQIFHLSPQAGMGGVIVCATF